MAAIDPTSPGEPAAAAGRRFDPSHKLAQQILDSAFPAPLETSSGRFHVGAAEALFIAAAAAPSELPVVDVARQAVTERLERLLSTWGHDAVERQEPRAVADAN